MKIGIDTEACTGHGRCYTLAPSLFEADEEGFGRLLQVDVPPELEAEARRAVSSCPEGAVTLEA
jgi:ferredoxin